LLAALTGVGRAARGCNPHPSDAPTSAVVFLGFRLSRRPATERYPCGLERAEDLAGIGIAVVSWASAAFVGYESVRTLLVHCPLPTSMRASLTRSSATWRWLVTSS
jgi:divalent metal cation (Fe/Co/Zn/Cd) transporter